jgi:hypothetical protein
MSRTECVKTPCPPASNPLFGWEVFFRAEIEGQAYFIRASRNNLHPYEREIIKGNQVPPELPPPKNGHSLRVAISYVIRMFIAYFW